MGLIFLAFAPQFLLAYLPEGRILLTDQLTGILFCGSLLVYLLFAIHNRRLPGIPIAIVGLISNFSVMASNGGFMPISPYAASQVARENVLNYNNLGDRIGPKDILLNPGNTRLEFLADRFLFPTWSPYQAAFSLGDVLIAVGAFWLLAKPVNTT